MNAFSALLLAYPFYLAVNGKLVEYISMAKSSASGSIVAGNAASSQWAGSSAVSQSDFNSLLSASQSGNTDAQNALESILNAGATPSGM